MDPSASDKETVSEAIMQRGVNVADSAAHDVGQMCMDMLDAGAGASCRGTSRMESLRPNTRANTSSRALLASTPHPIPEGCSAYCVVRKSAVPQA
jgi:hypothetical protein